MSQAHSSPRQVRAAAEPERAYRVPYSRIGAVFGRPEIEAIEELLSSGESLAGGPIRTTFERRCAELLGVRHAFAMPSCTTALELAIHLIGLEPGDEVIATPQTYQATLMALLARPEVGVKFCDIDPVSLNADPASIEHLVTDRTAAIILVHYGGLMADMDEIVRVARGCGALVVEDCAHAIGSSYHGRSAGHMGDLGCFSFQATKNISTLGQGGLLVCSDDRLAERIERLRSYEPDADFVPAPDIRFGEWTALTSGVYGHEKNAFTHDCREIRHGGMNGVLPEAAAAVGLVQLDRLDGLLARRAHVASIFDAGLAGLDGVRIQTYGPELRHAYHLYTFFVDPDAGIHRDELAGEIERRGVQIVLRYFPLHLLPEWRFRGSMFGECPVAERVWFTELLNLPCFPALSDGDAELVVEIVRDALDAVRS